MQIGKELKKLRLELRLSQTEMVGDILTKSYYSKIERGLHEINAKDLIEILERNRVNISDFFQGIESKGKSKKYLEQLRNAYYEQNPFQLYPELEGIEFEISIEQIINTEMFMLMLFF